MPLDSLATKIILFVFLSTFATAMVVSWTSIQSTHAHLSSAIDRQFPAARARARAAIRDWLGEAQVALHEAAASDAPLAKRLTAAPHFEDLFERAPDGGVRAATGRREDDLLAAIARSDGDPGVALHWLSAVPGGAAAMSVPRPGDTETPGLLVGILRSGEIESLLAGLRSGTGDAVLLTDETGRILFGRHGAARQIPELLLHDAATMSIHDYTNDAGIHVIHTSTDLGISGWHVAVEAPFDVVFAPMLSVIKRIFVIDLCIILLFSFLAYKITAAIVKPIEVLSDGARRIAQGQLDLEIPEPMTHDEIGLLTRTFNDMMRKLRGNQAEIESSNAALLERNVQLQQANEILEQLSITDGLTKLHNHRFFQDHLTREIKRVHRVEKPLSMILCDIDDFKALNDRLGHAAGDELLRRIARLMNESVRESDLLARYGGEEFVVLASDTDLEGARQLAEKIRTSIAESSFILDVSLRPTRTTISMGIALYDGNRKRFFAAADRALYQAKAAGKNCVMEAEESPQE